MTTLVHANWAPGDCVHETGLLGGAAYNQGSEEYRGFDGKSISCFIHRSSPPPAAALLVDDLRDSWAASGARRPGHHQKPLPSNLTGDQVRLQLLESRGACLLLLGNWSHPPGQWTCCKLEEKEQTILNLWWNRDIYLLKSFYFAYHPQLESLKSGCLILSKARSSLNFAPCVRGCYSHWYSFLCTFESQDFKEVKLVRIKTNISMSQNKLTLVQCQFFLVAFFSEEGDGTNFQNSQWSGWPKFFS